MRRFLCWWDGFYGTWIDPVVWGVRFRWALQGLGGAIVVDGHLYDLDNRVFEIIGDREIERTPCARCGRVLETGWRPMG